MVTETRPAPGMQMPSNPVTRIFLAPGQNTYQILSQLPGHGSGIGGGGNIGNGGGSGGNAGGDQVTPPPASGVSGFTPAQWEAMTYEERAAHLSSGLTVTSGNDHLTGGSTTGGGQIWNWPLNSIVIQKRCSVTSQLLQGAEFEVIHTSAGVSGTLGTVVGRFITDNSGIIVLTGLVGGSYVVREVNPPTNFTLSANNNQTVFLAPDGHSVVEVIFNNDPYGSLLLAKNCSVTGRPLANAVFRVTTSSGAVVGTGNGLFTTGANGEVLIPNLAPDSFVVTEVTAPDGFILDSTPQTIRIDATGNTYRLEFTNTPTSSLIVRKVSEETGQPLAGARFTVREQNGSLVTGGAGGNQTEFVTDSSGTFELQGLLGWFIIEEVSPPAGYMLAVDNVRTVEVRPGAPTTVTFANPRLSSTIIQKISGNGTNEGRPLQGVVFEVSRVDGARVQNPANNSFEFVTNAAGMIHLPRLEPGMYVATELRALPGYSLAQPVFFEVIAGRDQTITIRNYRLPNVTIRKISGDGDNAGRPLQGVVFEIDRADGSRVRNDIANSPQRGSYEFVTNNAGQIIIPTLEVGTYVLRETRALPGYRLAAPVNFTVTEGGEDVLVIVRNYKEQSVVIRKICGDTGNPLQNVQFEIARYLQNGRTGQRLKNYAVDNSYTFTTDAAGQIYLPAIGAGTWVAIETRPLPGFIKLDG